MEVLCCSLVLLPDRPYSRAGGRFPGIPPGRLICTLLTSVEADEPPGFRGHSRPLEPREVESRPGRFPRVEATVPSGGHRATGHGPVDQRPDDPSARVDDDEPD